MVFGRYPNSDYRSEHDARSDAHAAVQAVNAVNAMLANAFNSDNAHASAGHASAGHASAGHEPESGSRRRRKVFGECVAKNNGVREQWNLNGVHYDNRKLSDSELQGVYEWAVATWGGETKQVYEKLLSHAGQTELDRAILCRFMRPSELVRLMENRGQHISVHEASIPVDLDGAAKTGAGKTGAAKTGAAKNSVAKAGAFVGVLGSRLNALTNKHKLLYMWYHHNSRTVMAYCVHHDGVTTATRARKTASSGKTVADNAHKRFATLLADPDFSGYVDGSREIRFNTR
jgi:hypothetical protein